MLVEVLAHGDCPHRGEVVALVRDCLCELGLQVPVRERVGAFASPTVLIDGVDVMGSHPPVDPTVPRMSCRLDLSGAERLRTALGTAAGAGWR